MAKKRKIRCDCGEILEERTTKFNHFEAEAMVCPSCGFTTLTKEQAEKYAKIKQLHQIIDAERKIIKIGKKVKIEALDSKSFKIELMS